jgi:hypothetical protein
MCKNKLFITLFAILIAFTSCNNTKQTHLPESETVVGIWKQTGVSHPKTGEIINITTGNYKVMNSDGTYYTFVNWGLKNPKKPTTIGKYGTYKIVSGEIIEEHTIKHIIHPELNGSDDKTKYKFIDKNTLTIAWKHTSGRWINEKWSRLSTSRN